MNYPLRNNCNPILTIVFECKKEQKEAGLSHLQAGKKSGHGGSASGDIEAREAGFEKRGKLFEKFSALGDGMGEPIFIDSHHMLALQQKNNDDRDSHQEQQDLETLFEEIADGEADEEAAPHLQPGKSGKFVTDGEGQIFVHGFSLLLLFCQPFDHIDSQARDGPVGRFDKTGCIGAAAGDLVAEDF